MKVSWEGEYFKQLARSKESRIVLFYYSASVLAFLFLSFFQIHTSSTPSAVLVTYSSRNVLPPILD